VTLLNLLTLSHPTYVGPSGATAAATYQFFTKGYKPPADTSHLDSDTVHNQNGKFKYVYDNGPGFRRWPSFTVICQDGPPATMLGVSALNQYLNLRRLWNYKGVLGMEIAEEIYSVHWASETLEPAFKYFPRQVGDTIEREVQVQFEEA
jgi:hypothetical protein